MRLALGATAPHVQADWAGLQHVFQKPTYRYKGRRQAFVTEIQRSIGASNSISISTGFFDISDEANR